MVERYYRAPHAVNIKKPSKNILTPRKESGTREGEVMRMDLTKVGKLPTIEQRLAGTIGGAFAYLTPTEAIRLGNALIKAAQPKQKREGK